MICALSLMAILAANSSKAVEADAEELWKQKQSPAAAAAATAIRERAEREALALGDKHPWAGSYYSGDGLGVNRSLVLSPEAGFSFEWEGCLGPYDRNYGDVADDGQTLLMAPVLPNDARHVGLATALVPVTWGDRHYLVGFDKITAFCNDVNAGFEPRSSVHGSAYLRRGDETKTADGSPLSRAGRFHCLLDAPLQTRIVAVGGSTRTRERWGTDLTTFVTIDAGHDKGVYEGLWLFDAAFHFETRIVAVEEHTSRARVVSSGAKERTRRPTVGIPLTTRPSR